MLDREQGRDLVVLENDLARGVDDETDVKEAVLHLRMTGLGLRYHEHVVLARQPAERFCLFARDVDGAGARELNVVQIQHLVVERLQRTFRDRNQADWEVEARKPGSRFDQMGQMLEVDLDVLPLADASNCWYEPDCGVWADHSDTSISTRSWPAIRRQFHKTKTEKAALGSTMDYP